MAQEEAIYFSEYSNVYKYDISSKSKNLVYNKMDCNVNMFKVAKEKNMIFWTDKHMICTSNIDGSNIDTLLTDLSSPYAIDVDFNSNTIVWSDIQDKIICKSDIDGNNKTTLISEDIETPLSVLIDTTANKLY